MSNENFERMGAALRRVPGVRPETARTWLFDDLPGARVEAALMAHVDGEGTQICVMAGGANPDEAAGRAVAALERIAPPRPAVWQAAARATSFLWGCWQRFWRMGGIEA